VVALLEADTGTLGIAESRGERNTDGSRDAPPHGEGNSADQELRPYQKAECRRETAREVRRQWGCREHQPYVPRQRQHKISGVLVNRYEHRVEEKACQGNNLEGELEKERGKYS
jgi:hypothetical protein